MERLQQILVDAGYDLGKSGPKKNGVDGDPGKKTKAALSDYLKKEFKKKKFIWFDRNVGSFRMSGTFTDQFSDIGWVSVSGEIKSIFMWTTKPGKYYVCNPVTVGGITGTGCITEGQHLQSHKYVAKPKSKWGNAGYFMQYSKFDVYRDGNKDNKLDKNITQVAPTWYGFFLHAMGSGKRIWNWSAGCNGAPLSVWQKNVDPYFTDGQVINYTIIEI
mgnify:CR=1 FL=1